MKQYNIKAARLALEESYENFGQLLKQVRKKHGISAASLAKLADIHLNSQSNYENNKREPGIDYLVKYCSALNISFWKLLSKRVELGLLAPEYKHQIRNEIGPFYDYIKPQDDPAKSATSHSVDPQQFDQDNNQKIISACYQLMSQYKDKSQISTFKQDGDSMAPTIGDGATLFVDTKQCDLVEGQIFVFKIADTYSAKRIQLVPGGGIMLVSDNPKYYPVNMDKDELSSLVVQGKLMSSINHYCD